MFQMIKGASIPDASALKEEYTVSCNQLTANVSAEHILPVFEAFLRQMRENEPLYLFIEVPCKVQAEQRFNEPTQTEDRTVEEFHKDVYYLDGLFQEQMLMFLHSGVGELLIHDGLTHFGFGSLESQTELGKYKYNVLIGYTQKEPVDRLSYLFKRSVSHVLLPLRPRGIFSLKTTQATVIGMNSKERTSTIWLKK